MLGPGQSRARVARSLEERMQAASLACMSYWYYKWDWGEAAGFDGVWNSAQALDWSPGREWVLDHLAQEVRLAAAGERVSRFAPLSIVLRESALLGARDSQTLLRRALASFKSCDRGPMGEVLLDGDSRIFIDSLYGDPAFLVEIGLELGDEDAVSLGACLALGHLRRLQDESGLVRHFADVVEDASSPVHWGRGNGWAALGVSDLLEVLPSDHRFANELSDRWYRLATSLTAHQTPGGEWRNLISEEASYPETSTTAMVVAAFDQSVSSGVLPGDFRVSADRGWDALKHRIDANGHLTGASYRPGLNTEPARYEHVPAVGVYPWSNGPYLRAAATRLKNELS